jgi:hypothetical protein
MENNSLALAPFGDYYVILSDDSCLDPSDAQSIYSIPFPSKAK